MSHKSHCSQCGQVYGQDAEIIRLRAALEKAIEAMKEVESDDRDNGHILRMTTVKHIQQALAEGTEV